MKLFQITRETNYGLDSEFIVDNHNLSADNGGNLTDNLNNDTITEHAKRIWPNDFTLDEWCAEYTAIELTDCAVAEISISRSLTDGWNWETRWAWVDCWKAAHYVVFESGTEAIYASAIDNAYISYNKMIKEDSND